jgi:hypothetical protein
MNQTREEYIAGAKNNSLYWAERACEAGSEHLMYEMLIQWAMCDELFGEHWDRRHGIDPNALTTEEMVRVLHVRTQRLNDEQPLDKV